MRTTGKYPFRRRNRSSRHKGNRTEISRKQKEKQVSSVYDKLPYLKDEAQEGIKGDQGCEIAIPTPLQDTNLQQCLDHANREDDQNAADS